MKRILIISSLLGVLYAWFYFSDPKGKAKEEPISLSSIKEIMTSETTLGNPTQVYGQVTTSISCPIGGFLVLKNQHSRLVVLSRTITPLQGKAILATIVPRPMGVLQNYQLRIAALVNYQTLLEGQEPTHIDRQFSQR